MCTISKIHIDFNHIKYILTTIFPFLGDKDIYPKRNSLTLDIGLIRLVLNRSVLYIHTLMLKNKTQNKTKQNAEQDEAFISENYCV